MRPTHTDVEQLRHHFRYSESVRLEPMSTPPLTVQSAYHSDGKSKTHGRKNRFVSNLLRANMMPKNPNKRYIRGKDDKSQLLAFVNIMQMQWHLQPLALISS